MGAQPSFLVSRQSDCVRLSLTSAVNLSEARARKMDFPSIVFLSLILAEFGAGIVNYVTTKDASMAELSQLYDRQLRLIQEELTATYLSGGGHVGDGGRIFNPTFPLNLSDMAEVGRVILRFKMADDPRHDGSVPEINVRSAVDELQRRGQSSRIEMGLMVGLFVVAFITIILFVGYFTVSCKYNRAAAVANNLTTVENIDDGGMNATTRTGTATGGESSTASNDSAPPSFRNTIHPAVVESMVACSLD